MELKELQRNWDEFGRADPLWAIITWDEKRNGRWDPADFFALGEREIDELIADVRALGRPIDMGRALDFGCGVGRLTQPLARHFKKVYGIDIAESMIAKAREFNRHGDRVLYVLNDTADLHVLDHAAPFDFILSSITLQHIEPRYATGYVREFLRLLAPQGLAVFQIPSARITPPPPSPTPLERVKDGFRPWAPEPLLAAYRRLRRDPVRTVPLPAARPAGPRMEMYCIERSEVERVVAEAGGRVLSAVEDFAAGPGFVSYRYCVSLG